VVPETLVAVVPEIVIPPFLGVLADARNENMMIPHFTRLEGKRGAEWLV